MSHLSRTAPAVRSQTRLQLFGSFRLSRENQLLTLPTHKIQALLAFLVLEPEPHSREKLAALFWGDVPDPQARLSLRYALTMLRRELGSDLLSADRETVQLNPNFPLWVDALAFKDAIGKTKHTQRTNAAASLVPPPKFLDLYRGDLLFDFYDDWILAERERYRQLYIDALLHLTQHYRSASDYGRAIETARRILDTDPANERAHQHLMFCFVALGNRQGALEQYAKCVVALRDQVGAPPADETTALYDWITQTPSETHSLAASITNLPVPVTSFIGRETEMGAVKAMLALNVSANDQRQTVRLLTMTGAGGCGKTRLAIQTAIDLIGAYRDGVWWVDFGALRDGALVPRAVAKGLGLHEDANQSVPELLVNFLRFKKLLIVLDNCEHLIGACAELTELLLGQCPGIKVLATSREPLNVSGERVIPVPNLSLSESQLPFDQLMQSESVRLFVARAETVKPDLNWSERTVRIVADICRRLDGMPLAIELATARLNAFSPEQIAVRLESRFALLTLGKRTALPRQQTLRATIDWSYALLGENEQILLRRLAVFAGGWTLEAAEEVCSEAPLNDLEVADILGQLVNKSLVSSVVQGKTTRYRMLETIREYAAEKLAESGEGSQLRERHLNFFVHLAEETEPKLYAADQVAMFNLLDTENPNFRAALDYASNGKIEEGLRLGGALGRFWHMRGYQAEGREWLGKFLSRRESHQRELAPFRAKALCEAGSLAQFHSEFGLARRLLEESVALWRELNRPVELAVALSFLAGALIWDNDLAPARELLDESIALCRRSGAKRELAFALFWLGYAAIGWNRVAGYGERERDIARSSWTEGISLSDEIGDRGFVGALTGSLGRIAFDQGDYSTAKRLIGECLESFQEVNDTPGISVVIGTLGDIDMEEGNYAEAKERYEHSMRIWLRIGNQAVAAERMVRIAAVAIEQMEPINATRQLAAAAAQLELVQAKFAPAIQTNFARHVARVRTQLDEEQFKKAWEEGHAMSLEQAAAC